MNTCNSRVLLKTNDRETTLFVIDMTKANVVVPKLIKWDEVELPTAWQLERATPTLPRQAPEFQEIRQSKAGKVEIIFDRRNSFSSRTEATRSEYTSARRSFSVASSTTTIPRIIVPNTNLRGIETNSTIPRAEIYYNFLNHVKLNIPILDWFHAYTIKKNINYPFRNDLIGQYSTNVVWQLKDGEKVQSELPPKTQYQLPQIRDDKNNPVLAAPFKTKDVDENLTSKDIKSLMEQVNYTNKYLHVLGDKLAPQKSESSQSLANQAASSKHLDKPLFQPFKLSQKAKQNLYKAKVKANMDSDASELLSKINNLLKATTIPESPQGTEEASSRPKTRMPARTIGSLEQKSLRPSKSLWSCAAFYVNKQAEIERGTPRLVINYKPLNQALQWIRYPIPNKKYLLNRLHSAKIFSKFDMKSGYWQIQIQEKERYKIDFTVPFGQYEWNVMPFGLKNAPSEFQKIMNDIFNPYTNFAIVYIDDVLIFSQLLIHLNGSGFGWDLTFLEIFFVREVNKMLFSIPKSMRKVRTNRVLDCKQNIFDPALNMSLLKLLFNSFKGNFFL
uniref:Polyprotein n=1 Tax=Cajanus cajan TaxID=3821 RepID=A0A151RQ44_CAJCA|nr:polyprotein [Cajanus cajan]